MGKGGWFVLQRFSDEWLGLMGLVSGRFVFGHVRYFY